MHYAFSQNPYVKIWDKWYGGTRNEFLMQMIQTYDGGLLIGGYSNSSISGDKTDINRTVGCVVACPFDFWIVKTDSLGSVEWDKTYGGTETDPFSMVQQTTDSGFILAGTSRSNIGFEKSQNTQGNYDYWIVKTDALGNKIWDKDFGGTNVDNLIAVIQTSDGGYLLGGYSSSGVSVDKTQPSQGGYDYWIVKTDANGIKQWDKVFGGADDDNLRSIKQTPDGGYLLAGYSYSGATGDKSQPNQGNTDFWIIRTDPLGNKIWDKDFGAAEFDLCFSINIAPDGNYIAGGTTTSDIGGDKSQPLWGGAGDWDLWILKMDTLGNKLWDKDLGGYGYEDELGNISITTDGGLIIGATSYSTIGVHKSENNLGYEQTWMLKTDSMGDYMWDRTAFTVGHEETGYAIETSDGCYLVGNYTMAFPGGYKTEPNWDSTNNSNDYWIVKFCDSSTVPPTALATGDQFLCPGTCTGFLNLSFNASSYQWSFPGGIPASSTDLNPSNICYNTPGSFDVTLIATNSIGTDTLLLTNYITVYPQPPPQSILQNGDTLFANAGAVSYQWYYNGNLISGATNNFYIASSSGDYNVVATDVNDCEVEAVINDVIASVSQFPVYSSQFTVSPNPVQDKFTIHNLQVTSETAVEIVFYNILGEKLITNLPEARSQWPIEIDCHLFPEGLYILEINSGDKIFRTKFIKQ